MPIMEKEFHFPIFPRITESALLFLDKLSDKNSESYASFTFQIIFGMSLAAGMRVGLCLGAGDSKQARIASRVALYCGCKYCKIHI